MSTYLRLNTYQLCLPTIDLNESSEQAFADAFLRAAQILHQHLEQIESTIGSIKEFTRDPFNMAILGLFSKMNSHYHSYVFLEIHHDWIGSRFLIENLCEAAITLIYLLEEVDKSLFSEYISASVHQARYLLIDVKEQLQKFPNHPDLLILRDKLETFITKEQEHAAESPPTTNSEAYLWGPQEADTTAKRGAAMGLNFLTNPARQLALRVMPASWLDLQLSYLNTFDKSSRTQAQTGINFTNLRDAAHLCLHATQTFIEEVVNHQDVKVAEVLSQQQILNVLYEWFHNAYHIYQLHCSATASEGRGELGAGSRERGIK
jgi:hypothetical protein